MRQSRDDITLIEGDNPLNVVMVPIAIEEYTLTTDRIPSWGGWVSGAGRYDAGTSVTVQAFAEPGYKFSYWGYDLSGKTNPTTVIMNRDKHVRAYFEEVAVEYTLTLHASPSAGGSVSGAGTYPDMERVKITAHPKSGYYFDHWGGDFVSYDNPAYVYMSFDRDVTAYFYEEALEEFTVTVQADPSYGGTVSIDPDKPKYVYGELIRLSCTPASGYYLNYWTRDGEWIESLESFNTGVIRNHIFIAHFRKR